MLKPFLNPDIQEAGCDEAGRGPLAGPVYAAAVILPTDYINPLLQDSKKISEKLRNELRSQIESEAVAYSVARVEVDEIDQINILNASIRAMHLAVAGLRITPQHLLIDGNRFKKFNNIPFTTVIKGDSIYMSIAAASILAKTYRDEYMHSLHQEYPDYGWDTNKGYPTSKHREAIRKVGPSPHHRTTFNLLPGQFKLDL